LNGSSVVVTAGGTREPVDPVRVLTNRSSGIMGYACAAAAVAAGATVTVISANAELPPVAGASTVHVGSHHELSGALSEVSGQADAVIMAAAVSDFAPESAIAKMKKDGREVSLRLHELPDILAGLAQHREGSRPVLIGFAAETAGDQQQLIELATVKRANKGCDVIIANNVSGGAVFGQDATDIVIVDENGAAALGPSSKEAAAAAVIARLAGRLH
jgi:phosphopantothenoylcysteine decarboxylase/phosphopantothenate--cysteine ligase